MNENWHHADSVYRAVGTPTEWALVEKNLRKTAHFLGAQRSAVPHVFHVLRDAWNRPRAMHEEALRIRMHLEGPNAGFANFDHMLEYFRGRLAVISGHSEDTHYRTWKLPSILSLLARILSGGCEPSPRIRFIEWWCERLELLVSAGVAPSMNDAAGVHREQAVALAKTLENWADRVARPAESRVPPFFWHAMRCEFSLPRKMGVCYWTSARFGFYAGDYQHVMNTVSVLQRLPAMRVFEKVRAWPEHMVSACAAICGRETHVPEPTQKSIRPGFSREKPGRMCAEARWARGDFNSLGEFVRWQASI